MEYTLIIILLIVVLIVLLNFKNRLESRLNTLQDRMDTIAGRIAKLSEGKVTLEKEQVSEIRKATQPSPAVVKEPVQPPKELIKPEVPPVIEPEKPKEKVIENPRVEEPVIIPPVIRPNPVVPPKPPKPGFFERNPDLEKFIGENLANKIGIGVLVLGIGYFVKYAIDQEWINEYGRVFIGLLCGGILLGIAHRLRQKFSAFSSVLVGGGIAILYVTITIAFQQYQILGQMPAFIIMIAITGFTVLLSISYNRMELAILAILGGFGSPFMVSTGEGDYVTLFTYVLVLDVGMLVLAYFKRWHPVNIIAYALTVILFGSWLVSRYDPEALGMGGALTFATLFYVTFFAMNIINNLKERTKFNPIEISLLLSNTFLYYAAGMAILDNESGEVYRGFFTAAIGVFNFVFAFLLYKSQRVDRNLVFMLIGLVLTFISLAAPVQLEGNYITLFWAAEAVLLLWLSQQSGIRLMKYASMIVMGLMWISLALDWNNVYDLETYGTVPVLLNKGFITSVVAVVSMILFLFFVKRETDLNAESKRFLQAICTVVLVVVVYSMNFLELNYQLNEFVNHAATRSVIIGTYHMLFLLALIAAERKLPLNDRFNRVFPAIGMVAVLIYLVFYHLDTISTRDAFIAANATMLGFAFHYALVILLVIICFWSLSKFRQREDPNVKNRYLYSWFFVFAFVFLASAELDHTVVLALNTGAESVSRLLQQNHKIGYPILWGVFSFVIIAIGLQRKRKHLRYISLTLFLVTLVKLFLVDIRGISDGGKIAAFISLGVLLLIISFMYQRLKRILFEDDQKSEISNEAINERPAE